MSQNCPLCGHDLGEVTFYVRWFSKGGRFEHCITTAIRPSNRRFPRGMIWVNGTDQQSVDIVNLVTGKVVRKDFKRPLPEWIDEPVLRALVVASGDIPPIYKNSKIEKLKLMEKKGVDGKAVPA